MLPTAVGGGGPIRQRTLHLKALGTAARGLVSARVLLCWRSTAHGRHRHLTETRNYAGEGLNTTSDTLAWTTNSVS